MHLGAVMCKHGSMRREEGERFEASGKQVMDPLEKIVKYGIRVDARNSIVQPSVLHLKIMLNLAEQSQM